MVSPSLPLTASPPAAPPPLQPKTRDNVSRPPVIPPGVAAKRAAREAGDKRKTEKDLQARLISDRRRLVGAERGRGSAVMHNSDACKLPRTVHAPFPLDHFCFAGGAGRRGRVQQQCSHPSFKLTLIPL